MVEARKIIFVKRFEGSPQLSDFREDEEILPSLKDGEALAEAIYLTVDPYMRLYIEQLPVGSTMPGGQIAKIIESKNANYPPGAIIYGSFGWRTHTIFNPDEPMKCFVKPFCYVLPSYDGLPISLGLGHFGSPGIAALYGILEICRPKQGEIVVVSGAAGACGHVAGQIAKILGCKVIGIAGSSEKCSWLIKELGFDYAINYKTESVALNLIKYAPDGVDCYFDNVGGEVSSDVIKLMRDYGRIALCGAISSYNSSIFKSTPLQLHPSFVYRQLTMTGYVVHDRYLDKWFDSIDQLKQWTYEGKLKYHETITNGFENMPEAFIDMFQGNSIGKAVVKV